MKKILSLTISVMLIFAALPNMAMAKTPVSSVTLNAKASYMKIGKSKTFRSTIKPTAATNKSVTWTSSNTAVATVSSKGVVKAMGVGVAIVKAVAKDGSKKSGSCVIKVVEKVDTAEVANSLVNRANKYFGKNGKQLGYSTAWCAYFVGKCAKETGIPENVIPNSTGLVKTLWETMKKTTKVYYVRDFNSGRYKPAVGDLVFLDTYKPLGHIGVISDVYDDGSFDTIDGNVATSNTNPKYTEVLSLEYSVYAIKNGKSNSKINSFIRPNYSKVAD